MSFSPSSLPDDIAELKRLVASKDAELAAARNGLLAATLEIEKLKAQLARLRRQAYGQSSERLAREIEQLELKPEEIKAAAGEAETPRCRGRYGTAGRARRGRRQGAGKEAPPAAARAAAPRRRACAGRRVQSLWRP